MRNTRWSPQARKWLAGEQADLYARLGERAGLGTDPMQAFLRFGSDRMPADWIRPEKFEKTFAADWSQAPGWGAHRETIARFVQFQKEVELPTPYEDPNRYPMMVEMADALEKAIASAQPIPFKPLLGSLPSGEINARSMLLRETSEYLVLFEHGLFEFVYQLSKVLAPVFPKLVPDGTSAGFAETPNPTDAIAASPGLVDQFVEVVGAYVVHGNPGRVRRCEVPEASVATAAMLVRAMEMFVLGHEYGHIILGHLRHAEPAPPASSQERADRIAWSWQQEYDADEVGFSMASRTLSWPLAFGYWGTEAFFGGMDILDRCRALLSGASLDRVQQSATHPPMPLRRERLRAALPEIAPAQDRPMEAIELGRNVQTALDVFWQRSLPQWTRMRDDGMRPSVLWS